MQVIMSLSQALYIIHQLLTAGSRVLMQIFLVHIYLVFVRFSSVRNVAGEMSWQINDAVSLYHCGALPCRLYGAQVQCM